MFPLTPRAIYVTEEVLDDPLCVARMEGMMAAMGVEDYVHVDYADLDRLALAHGWAHPRRKGEIRNEPPDPVVFTKLKWPSKEEEDVLLAKYPHLCRKGWLRGALLGHLGWSLRGPAPPKPGGTVCQRAFELHTIAGCPYLCDYCSSLSEVIVIGLNVEELMSQMDGWVASCPDQTLFKWDNASDTLCFEPEYGATKMLIEYFAGQAGKYFLLYAGKCADVDWLLDLNHRGKTILAFSISGSKQSRLIEKRSNTMEERIEAMRKCQAAGYIVRARFAPIVPVANWREENRTMIKHLFSEVQPDILSIDTVQRMNAMDAHRCMDLSLWDQSFVEAMDRAAIEMDSKMYGPLPHDKRAEVYRFIIDEVKAVSPQTPIGLCLESYEMWEVLGQELGMCADHYVCNCGHTCTPGTELYREFVSTASTSP